MAKVLVVEDDPVTSSLIRFCLEKQHQVVIATTVREALECIVTHKPHVLVLDYVLPDGTAREILEYVRKERLHTRSIIVTKYSNLQIIRECRLGGAFDFIQKPIDHRLLTETVDIALSHPDLMAQHNEPNLAHPQPLVDAMTLDIEAFQKNVSSDEGLLKTVLETTQQELRTHSRALATFLPKLHQLGEHRDALLFLLHRLESVSASIYAAELQQTIEALSASLRRQEVLAQTDLALLEQCIARVLVAIEVALPNLKTSAPSKRP
jgi:two-component system chemotaxis response regulator CheY